mmetsp:Transcript_15138/g.38538  ORF Transcript_15138/g.38538 Transcript_15138/m.38538 type:complete len:211 (-) Transcript_15138:53-685(-)
MQRAQPTREQKRLERREARPEQLLRLGDFVHKVAGFGRDGARDNVGVAADVLGRRVDRDVDARDLEAALVEGCRERRVAHDDRPRVARGRVRVGHARHSLEVRQAARGVRGRLGVHDLGVGAQRLAVLLRVGRVDKRVLDAPLARKLDEELVRAAVHRVRHHGVVARLEHRHERARDGRHARREEHTAAVRVGADTLERGQLPRRSLVGR